MTNPLKQGLTYISTNGQLRYASQVSKNLDTSEFTYENEHWVQPISMYRAAQQVQAGRPVSVARPEDLLEPFLSDEESYVVLTNPKIHQKCIGIAMNPALPGEMIHILPFGTIKLRLNNEATFPKYNNENKLELTDPADDTSVIQIPQNYIPPFLEGASYTSLIGKTIFVNSLVSNGTLPWHENENTSDNYGVLTIDEQDAYASYGNIIQIGHITDYNTNADGPTELIVEVNLEGDGRGPKDFTQYVVNVEDPFVIRENDGLKIFALGQNLPDSYRQKFNIFKSDTEVSARDFIAISDISHQPTKVTLFPLSANFPFVTDIDGNVTSIDVDSFDNANDRTVLQRFMDNYNYLKETYPVIGGDINENINIEMQTFTPDGTVESATKFVNTLSSFLGNAAWSTLDNTAISSSNGLDPFDIISFELASINGGMYEVYISRDLYQRNFFASPYMDVLPAPEAPVPESRNGKLIFADIRYGQHQNIIGAYAEGRFNDLYEHGEQVVVTRYGEVTLPPQAGNLEPGLDYYLAQDGNITSSPDESEPFRIKLGFAKDERTLIMAPQEIETVGPEIEYIGHIKPITRVTKLHANGTTTEEIQHGYVEMGTTLDKAIYGELYSVIINNYNWTITETADTFTLPTSTPPMMIKYKQEYKSVPNKYAKVMRYNGKFTEVQNETITPCVISSQNEPRLDITPLIKEGLQFFSSSATNNYDILLSNLDVRLFVNLGENAINSDWVEISQGFNLYNNTTFFGYRWKTEYDTVNDRFYLVCHTEDTGIGIAYQETPFSPPTLLNNLEWKVSVRKHSYYQESFDITSLLEDIVSDRVHESLEKIPVSSTAIIEYLQNINNLVSLNVSDDFSVGHELELANSFKVYLPDNIKAEFVGGVLFRSYGKVLQSNNLGLLEYTSATDWWENAPIILDELMLETLLNNTDVFNPKRETLRNNYELLTFEGLEEHSNLKADFIDVTTTRQAPHGIICGIDGTINAARLGGLQLGKHTNKAEYKIDNALVYDRNFDTTTAFIPFVDNGIFGIENTIIYSDKSTHEEIVRHEYTKVVEDLNIATLGQDTILTCDWHDYYEKLNNLDILSIGNYLNNLKVNSSVLYNDLVINNSYQIPVHYTLLKDFNNDRISFNVIVDSYDETLDFEDLENLPEATTGNSIYGTFKLANLAEEPQNVTLNFVDAGTVFVTDTDSDNGVFDDNSPIENGINNKYTYSLDNRVLKIYNETNYSITTTLDYIDNFSLRFTGVEVENSVSQTQIIEYDPSKTFIGKGLPIQVYLRKIHAEGDNFMPVSLTKKIFQAGQEYSILEIFGLGENTEGLINNVYKVTSENEDDEIQNLSGEFIQTEELLPYNDITFGLNFLVQYQNAANYSIFSDKQNSLLVEVLDSNGNIDKNSIFFAGYTVEFYHADIDYINKNITIEELTEDEQLNNQISTYGTYDLEGLFTEDANGIKTAQLSALNKEEEYTYNYTFNHPLISEIQISNSTTIIRIDNNEYSYNSVVLNNFLYLFNNGTYFDEEAIGKIRFLSSPINSIHILEWPENEYKTILNGTVVNYNIGSYNPIMDMLTIITPYKITKNKLFYNLEYKEFISNFTLSIDYSNCSFKEADETNDLSIAKRAINDFIRFPDNKFLSENQSLTNDLTFKYNSLRPVTNEIGGIPKGYTFTDAEISEVLDKLFTKVDEPSLSLSFPGYSNMYFNGEAFIKGSTQKITNLELSYKSGLYSLLQFEVFRDDIPEPIAQYTFTLPEKTEELKKVILNIENEDHASFTETTQLYVVIKTQDDLSKIIKEYTHIGETTIHFVDPIFIGAIDRFYFENEGHTLDFTAGTSIATLDNKVIHDYSAQFDPQASRRFWIALPANKTLLGVYDQNSFNLLSSFEVLDTKYTDPNFADYEVWALQDFNHLDSYTITYHIGDK